MRRRIAHEPARVWRRVALCVAVWPTQYQRDADARSEQRGDADAHVRAHARVTPSHATTTTVRRRRRTPRMRVQIYRRVHRRQVKQDQKHGHGQCGQVRDAHTGSPRRRRAKHRPATAFQEETRHDVELCACAACGAREPMNAASKEEICLEELPEDHWLRFKQDALDQLNALPPNHAVLEKNGGVRHVDLRQIKSHFRSRAPDATFARCDRQHM